ncbi:MAG: glucoamylase family protein [Thermoanaerobaculia bacterium]
MPLVLLPACAPRTAEAPSPAAPAPPAGTATPPPVAAPSFSAADLAFLDDLEHRTFRFFWERANPRNGLVPDRWPTKSFSSIAGVGFGLTAYPIGVERGWVTRAAAAERTATTLRALWELPQGEVAAGAGGYRGFFYHFLDMETGRRFERVELSSVDTALLLGGVLFARGYFDRDPPVEREIRDLAARLYGRIEWDWMRPRPPKIAMGWTPEEGFGADDWNGYNEAMIVYLLALGSPTHAVDPAAWAAWTKTYRPVEFQGQRYIDFAPLFGHHYSHLWVDFLGIRDAAVQANGFDYFENSRRATLAQRAWAIANPRAWRGFGANVWGVSACDGPADVEHAFAGEKRRFWTYAGRGVGPGFPVEDGTIAPTAAGGSIAFAPEIVLPALVEMKRRYGDALYGEYGFVDAFNPSFDFDVAVPQGRVVRGVGWFDTDYLAIDQGPIVGMIENYRSGLVWRVMRRDPDLRRGLERAGFTGGWLASTAR